MFTVYLFRYFLVARNLQDYLKFYWHFVDQSAAYLKKLQIYFYDELGKGKQMKKVIGQCQQDQVCMEKVYESLLI